jgi:hypothetical protein
MICMLERGYLSVAVPQFNVVPVNQLLGLFFGGFVVWAKDRNCVLKMAVTTYDVDAIIRHGAALKIRREHYLTHCHRMLPRTER